jgi:hypothetical protein
MSSMDDSYLALVCHSSSVPLCLSVSRMSHLETESCLPVCSLHEAGDELFLYDVSWADAYHMPKDNYEQQYCFHAVNPSIIPAKARPHLPPLYHSSSSFSLSISGKLCLAGSCSQGDMPKRSFSCPLSLIQRQKIWWLVGTLFTLLKK